MARPRTPTNVLDARGSFRKHPERAAEREGEPETNGDIGDPPAHMTDYEQSCWHEFVAVAFSGTLCKADRLTVELAACLIAKSRTQPDKFLAAERQQLIALYGRFGMTPSDRSKVSTPKKQVENPLAALMRKNRV